MANPSQSQEFTGAGSYTFTAPTGVSCVYLTMIGAGGGGGGTGTGVNDNDGGGGGGSGEFCIRVPYKVTPGNGYTVVIGAGGIGVKKGAGGDGTATTFDSVIQCDFGDGGWPSQSAGGSAHGGGGGTGGAVGPAGGANGITGTLESVCFFGGSRGAGETSTGQPTANGGASAGHLGGVKGTNGAHGAGGGGGAASPWGVGANGGNGSNDGNTPASTAYGCGGGGAGGDGTPVTHKGGAGMDGYCLVEWEAP